MFDERLEVYLADTRESRQLHFRLRYQIYCEERGYEPRHQFPNGQERDPADDQSVHFLVRARHTGAWLATLRLVLPGPAPFPIRGNCALRPSAGTSIPWKRCGEISRLGVVRTRPAGGGTFPLGDAGPTPIPTRWVPEITFGLFRATYSYCVEHRLDHCLWMSTPSLVRLLNRYHLPMRPIGEPCEFRGKRQPFIIDVEPFWRALARATEVDDPLFHRRHGFRRWSQAPPQAPAVPDRTGDPDGAPPLSLLRPALGTC